MSHGLPTSSRLVCVVFLLIALLVASGISALLPTPASAASHVPSVTGGGSPHLFYQRGKASHAVARSGPTVIGGNMINHGGSVMHGNAFVYAIFWEPTGRVSSNYNNLIKRYFVDVGFSPLYQIGQQYGDDTRTPPVDAVLAGSWVDTRAYPANPLQDSDIQNEVVHAQQQNGWGPNIQTVFFVFTESGEVICNSSGCSNTVFCGYHNHFGSTLYAAIPYVPDSSGCNPGSSPNHDVADWTINVASHEQMEAATDPNGTAWYDNNNPGNEIGDKCAFTFAPVDGSGADVHWGINNDPYIVQEEWDNSTSSCQIGMGAAPVVGPNPTLSSPSVLRDGAGNQYAYFNAGGVLEEDFYSITTKQWSGPWAIGGNIIGSPSALLDGAGNQFVYFNNGGLPEEDFYSVSSNSWFGPWAIGGSNITGSPVVLRDGAGNQYAYINAGGVLEEDFYSVTTNSWNGPWAIGGSNAFGSPSVLRDSAGNQFVYFNAGGQTSVGGVLEEDFYSVATNSWNGPWAIGGSNAFGSPSALLDGAGNQYVYFNNGALPEEDFYSVTTNSWSGPWTIGGTAVNSPVALRDSANNQYVYFSSAGFLVEAYYTSSANTWLGPSPTGGSINS